MIEPSAGADRATLAFLCEAYCEDTVPDENGKPTERVVLKLHPRLAPIKAAIFPLVNKDGMPEVAQRLYRELKGDFNVFYDDKGAVGRRYRRQDEAGTPYCFTIDGQTLQDNTVTIRGSGYTQARAVTADGSIGSIAPITSINNPLSGGRQPPESMRTWGADAPRSDRFLIQ